MADNYTVWKYELTETDMLIEMPRAALVAHVACQGQDVHPTLWMLVDTDQPKTMRHFSWHGTGHPHPHPKDFLGTTMCLNDKFVWHVYERFHAD